MPQVYPKAKYWILTIPHPHFTPFLPPGISYIKGQLERGEGNGVTSEGSVVEPNQGFLHWQVVALFDKQVRLQSVRQVFGDAHAEPTRSEAAMDYVWKEDTSVEGTRFELGKRPKNRNSETDWDQIYSLARSGDLENIEIPRDILIRSYHSLRAIAKDNCKPRMRGEQEVNVFWGVTGAGKSHRAFLEAGDEFYLKMPTTKWFDGYQGEPHIIIDEFSGTVDIVHLLKWLDKYPCAVEIKGSQVALKSKKWWIMSNVAPDMWYTDKATPEQQAALMRRLTNIVEFTTPFVQ